MMIVVIKDNEITNVAYPFPINNPEEGLHPDGSYVIYLEDLGGLQPHEFIEQRYWDGTTFQARGPRPSTYCIWNGTAWVVDEVNYLKQVRYERDVLLYRSDWTQLPDAPIGSSQLTEALTYRQALRDMTDPILADPQAYVHIEGAPWPTPPDFLNAN